MKTIILTFFIFSISIYNSQTNLPCNDGGFESLNLTTWGWQMEGFCRTSSSASLSPLLTITTSAPTVNAGNLNATISGIVNFGQPAAYSWEIVNSGADPLIGSNLSTSRSGRALKMGTTSSGNAVETIRKTFFVTENNRFINFWYAIVFASGNNHNNSLTSPFFGVKINNQFVNTIPSFGLTGNPIHKYSNAIYPMASFNNLRYRNWTCASVDLSIYIGQQVTFEFLVGDCSAITTDYGYVYIDDVTCTSEPLQACGSDGDVSNLVESEPCKKFCFDYRLPQFGSTFGSVQFILRNYNSAGLVINSFSSPVITGSNPNSQSYCFNNISPSTGTLKVEAVYTLSGVTWSKFSNVLNYQSGCEPCCLEDTIYSSSKYGYNRSLPIIVSNNAKYHEIEFCSFEENNFVLPATSVGAENQYDGIIPNNLTYATFPNSHGLCVTNIAHTGKKSLQVKSENNPEFSVKLQPLDKTDNGLIKDANHFIVVPPIAIEPQFNLLQGKKYKLRVWLKSDKTSSTVANMLSIKLKKADGTIITTNSTGSFITDPIEGWRLYEMNIPNINLDTRDMIIQFHGGDADETRFFDDLRIIPEDALAKSYVYHERSLKLIGELDENHFATFYDYDEAGNLMRVRKETERGIVTLKEATTNYQKKR